MWAKMATAVMLLAFFCQTCDYAVDNLGAFAIPINASVKMASPEYGDFSQEVSGSSSSKEYMETQMKDLKAQEGSLGSLHPTEDTSIEHTVSSDYAETVDTTTGATTQSRMISLEVSSKQTQMQDDTFDDNDTIAKIDDTNSTRTRHLKYTTVVDIMRANIPALKYDSVPPNDSVEVFVKYNDDKQKYDVVDSSEDDDETTDDGRLLIDTVGSVVLESGYSEPQNLDPNVLLMKLEFLSVIFTEYCNQIFTLFHILSFFFCVVGLTIGITLVFLIRDLNKFRCRSSTDNSEKIPLTETQHNRIVDGNAISSVGIRVRIGTDTRSQIVKVHQQVSAKKGLLKKTKNSDLGNGPNSDALDGKSITEKAAGE